VVGVRCLPRIQAGPTLLTRTAGPVALGSPTGSIDRPDHRLLWPHLRLCRPPAGLWIIPSGCLPVPTEGPQFTLPVLLTMPLPVLRWLQRLHLTMPSPLVLPSPLYHGLGNHNFPTNPDPMGSLYRSCNIRFMLRPGHLLALLRSGLLLPSLLGPGRPLSPKSVISRWFIVIFHRRTLTGWTISIMGCTSSRAEARRWLGQQLPMFRPFRVAWQKAIRPSISFPLPPLKFRTVGFPQYGFKQAVGYAFRSLARALTYL